MTTRRRLLALGLVPLLCSAGLAVKVGLMEHRVDVGSAAVADGDPDRARSAFAANASVNVLEPWVAPYDEGVAAYLQGEPAAAVTLFAAALADAPAEEECRVRTNLALATEAVGDETRSRLRWFEAREVLGPCLAEEVPARVDARLQRKLDAAAAAAAREAEVAEPDRPAQSADDEELTAAERLEQLNAQGRRTRERDRERERRQRERPDRAPSYDW